MVRASNSGAGGRRFDPVPRHTRDVKMVQVANFVNVFDRVVKQNASIPVH